MDTCALANAAISESEPLVWHCLINSIDPQHTLTLYMNHQMDSIWHNYLRTQTQTLCKYSIYHINYNSVFDIKKSGRYTIYVRPKIV